MAYQLATANQRRLRRTRPGLMATCACVHAWAGGNGSGQVTRWLVLSAGADTPPTDIADRAPKPTSMSTRSCK
eukprot:8754110-Alexandrium_andersonii.AAC.1